MPLPEGQDAGKSIRELRGGKVFARTKRKHGTKAARKQSIAIALENERKGKKHTRKTSKRGRRLARRFLGCRRGLCRWDLRNPSL